MTEPISLTPTAEPTFVITTTAPLSRDAVRYLRDALSQAFSDGRPVVLDPGMVLHDLVTGRSYGSAVPTETAPTIDLRWIVLSNAVAGAIGTVIGIAVGLLQ